MTPHQLFEGPPSPMKMWIYVNMDITLVWLKLGYHIPSNDLSVFIRILPIRLAINRDTDPFSDPNFKFPWNFPDPGIIRVSWPGFFRSQNSLRSFEVKTLAPFRLVGLHDQITPANGETNPFPNELLRDPGKTKTLNVYTVTSGYVKIAFENCHL